MRHNASGISAAQARGGGLCATGTGTGSVVRMMLGNVIQWSFITQQWSEIQADLVQHIQLTLIAVGLGLCISIPLSLLAWAVQRGTAVLTTPKTAARARENFDVTALPQDAFDQINHITTRQRLNEVVKTGSPGFIPRST